MKNSILTMIAQSAKKSSSQVALLSTHEKNKALFSMAKAIKANRKLILRENLKDLKAAKAKKLAESMLKRLELDDKKINAIADSIELIAKLPDPVGRLLSTTKRPNGLLIKKVGVPIGVILIIYESRPNVTADCMALCLKSGNSVILKGGSEARQSNAAIFKVLKKAAVRQGVPEGSLQLVNTTDRSAVRFLLGMNTIIDLVIPRGGEGLIREVARISKIPVIKHFKGVCHVYVDKKADLKKAENIVVNAKVQNPSVCNAMETLLVHRDVAKNFLTRITRVLADRGVELRGCDKSRSLVRGLKEARETDWYAEYLDLILAIRVVKDVQEAVSHIEKYGSRHSDAIVTRDKKSAAYFTHSVDSACVFVNCSTRFNDGGEFGMGAEMGISTDKLHARGPMGLEELTSYKYVVVGDGQTRH